MQKAIALALLAVLPLFAMSGCVHVAAGERLDRKDVTFIRPGATTKTQVISTLGVPIVDLANGRVIAYAWEMQGAKLGYNVMETYRKMGSGDVYHAFCVAFDKNDLVTHRGFLEDIKPGSLEAAVLGWFKSGRD